MLRFEGYRDYRVPLQRLWGLCGMYRFWVSGLGLSVYGPVLRGSRDSASILIHLYGI